MTVAMPRPRSNVLPRQSVLMSRTLGRESVLDKRTHSQAVGAEVLTRLPSRSHRTAPARTSFPRPRGPRPAPRREPPSANRQVPGNSARRGSRRINHRIGDSVHISQAYTRASQAGALGNTACTHASMTRTEFPARWRQRRDEYDRPTAPVETRPWLLDALLGARSCSSPWRRSSHSPARSSAGERQAQEALMNRTPLRALAAR